MISLSIKNYEAIRDLTIKIEGFTGITGLSNVGKSSIIRSLWSAIYNDSTARVIHWGAQESHVSVKFLEPHLPLEIDWKRFRQTSEVVVNQETVFRKLAGKAPPPIEKYGFRQISGRSPNFHLLGDPFFLLGDHVSVVSDIFQEVLKFSAINTALDLCNADKRKTSATLGVRRSDLDDAKEDAENIPALAALHAQIQDILDLNQQISTVKGRLQSISECLQTQEEIVAYERQSEPLVHILQDLEGNASQLETRQTDLSLLHLYHQTVLFSALRDSGNVAGTVVDSIVNLSERCVEVSQLHLFHNELCLSQEQKYLSVKGAVQDGLVLCEAAEENYKEQILYDDLYVERRNVETEVVEKTKEKHRILDDLREIDEKLQSIKMCPLCETPLENGLCSEKGHD